MARIKIVDLLKKGKAEEHISVYGWVRTKRGNKHVNFVALNDGSTIHNLQIVVDMEKTDDAVMKAVTTGAAICAKGILQESQGSGQSIELHCNNIEVLGESNPETYPLQPKRHSLEFMREIAHLRMRTSTFSAISRLRHAMIFAVHEFFNGKGFLNIHTPIITASDAEGAGEMFRVTTLDAKNPPLDEEGKIDYKQDFFGKATNLTVSGQLEGELAAMALGEVYTFGPTFRAENSNTTRHLSEFWMIEPEMAFYDIVENMDLAEEFLKYLIKYALDNCMDDLKFLSQRLEQEEKNKPQAERSMELIEKLEFVLANDFIRLTYTEAIQILQNSKPNKKKKFQYPVEGFGTDLQSEHERFLVEKHFKKPVILTDYPADIKSFYMKQNDDGKTVRAMDILFPGIGEIVGGSQREESLEKLTAHMDKMGVPTDEMSWYLDTRRYGSAVHSGFGLGFERLMLFVSGMTNIRDVIPFPRAPKQAEF
ncbi:MAG: asparagine--tRNA ligase [Bacteroidales bacterium]|jgi:asparaginyl-tRNA synthetase|nr:asparagine--tRNA ligase [Bacteroidales bacterium]